MPRGKKKQVEPPSTLSIREEYVRHGSAEYYRQFGAAYRNPHEPIVARGITRAVEQWKLDISHVLDLAAGSGEATLALRACGAVRVDGIDPWTAPAYQQRTGMPCETFSFADIAGGALAGRRYSLIVCSFALHLCDASRLPALAFQLAEISPTLLILTPHKRPMIRADWGWTLIDEVIADRVRTRVYIAVSKRDVNA